MKYAGLPMAMWAAFHGSFTQHLTTEFGLTQQQAKAVEQLAKQKYRELIEKIPEFEKGDRFKMNILCDAGGGSEFIRQYTLASGGPYCDCGYHKK